MGPTLVQGNKGFDNAMQSTLLRWGQHLYREKGVLTMQCNLRWGQHFYRGTRVKQINQLVFVIEISVGVVFVIEISV